MTIHPHFPNSTPAELPPLEALAPATRSDGWTPERQRRFLECIAEGHTVEDACRIVGMSVNSAYVLRRRAAGQAFALGWRAANLIARDHLADALLVRAIEGQEETTTRGDVTITRRRFDNRLAANMLARLDREARETAPDAMAARMIAGEFEAYLATLENGAGNLRAATFLAARADAGLADDLAPVAALARADRFARHGTGLAQEVDVADLDLAHTEDWSAEQWRRAHAGGLLTLTPLGVGDAEDEEPELASEELPLSANYPHLTPAEDVLVPLIDRIWWDERNRRWKTDFPLPAGVHADDYGDQRFGDPDYSRSLTKEEEAAVAHWPEGRVPTLRERNQLGDRAAFFAQVGNVPSLEHLLETAEEIVRLGSPGDPELPLD